MQTSSVPDIKNYALIK